MTGFLGKFAAVAIATAGVLQPAEPTGPAAVMEALLFGFDMAPPSRTAGVPADVQRSLARYRARVRMFRPTIERPRDLHGPEGSLYYKRIGVERAIFALFDRPEIVKLADEYARQADLFYEWEGFADSPISEAASADSFLVQHPGSPIASYVQLFAGHRKLCAVSGLEGLDPRSDRGQQVARGATASSASGRTSSKARTRSARRCSASRSRRRAPRCATSPTGATGSV